MEKNILIFGNGWLGNKYKDYFNADITSADITNYEQVIEAVKKYNPSIILNCAGKTGRPNVDWCELEENKGVTVASNIAGPLVLLKVCTEKNLKFVHVSSGCIFNGEAPGPNGFTEEDKPIPVSFYAWTKAAADNILRRFPVLILRIRMPIDKEDSHRNLINKITKYDKIIDIPNSVTVVDDLLYATKELIAKGCEGIYNIVNPESIRHTQTLGWYKEIVDSNHKYEVIQLDNLYSSGLAKARRSNCVLDTSKLQAEGIRLCSSEEAIKDCLKSIKEQRDALNRPKNL